MVDFPEVISSGVAPKDATPVEGSSIQTKLLYSANGWHPGWVGSKQNI